ncbi:MAG: hypothetical protein KDC83_10065 [Flavobacteriales bacterium]|nr:hypothetical protein [Flavobacteriales bacterium]
MNKTTFCKWGFWSVAILNVMLMAFFFLGKGKRGHGPEGPKKIIIQKLGFDDVQKAQYEVLIKNHQSEISDHDNRIKELKNALYKDLVNPLSQPEIDSIIMEITGSQTAIEAIHLAHFRDIKALCTPEQIPAYENLAAEIEGLFSRRHPKP